MKKEYTLHEEMLKVMTEEQITLSKVKWDLLEETINTHPFLKKQLDNGNIEMFVCNLSFLPYVTYADLDKINTCELSYHQWKTKTYNAMKKIGLVRDVEKYCGYILK
jgi:hypothetical protein